MKYKIGDKLKVMKSQGYLAQLPVGECFVVDDISTTNKGDYRYWRCTKHESLKFAMEADVLLEELAHSPLGRALFED